MLILAAAERQHTLAAEARPAGPELSKEERAAREREVLLQREKLLQREEWLRDQARLRRKARRELRCDRCGLSDDEEDEPVSTSKGVLVFAMSNTGLRLVQRFSSQHNSRIHTSSTF